MTRKQQATATITRVKGGDYIVVTPDDKAVVADTIAEAKMIAYARGAVVISWRNVGPEEV